MQRPATPPLVAALALALAGCSGGTPPAPVARPDPTLAVASGQAGGYAVRLLAAAPLQVGLNALALEVQPVGSTAPVTDAAVEFLPLLTTTTTDPGLADVPHVVTSTAAVHGCPVRGPSAPGADGRHPLEVVFQTPSGPGTWTAEVAVSRGGVAARVPLSTFAVAEAPGGARWRLVRSLVEGGTAYVAALEFLAPVTVGVVPAGVALHEAQDSGMRYAPVSDATLGLVPEMPDMGHGGGSGGMDPVLVTSGWYQGSVSFTMGGRWVVTVPVSRGGTPFTSPPAFEVLF